MEIVAAFLLTQTCTLEIWGDVDHSGLRLVAVADFADRELCDQLLAWGVKSIQVVDQASDHIEKSARPALVAGTRT